jgi:DNA-binding LytR/AlgR family response regulator
MPRNPMLLDCLEHRAFFCNQKGFVILTLKEIIYIKAARAESVIFTTEMAKGFTVPISITELQEELSGLPFLFKPHRSYLVNLYHLKAYCKSDGVLKVTACPGARAQELPLADAQRDALMEVLRSLGWQEVRGRRCGS